MSDTPQTPSERKRVADVERSRRRTAKGSEIGDYPAVVNPERREACRHDLVLALRTYFPMSCDWEFSPAHVRMIRRDEEITRSGGRNIRALPRGSGKTTIAENQGILLALYGLKKFIPVFGAESKAAESSIQAIKMELAENDLLYEDFPEVCHAIRALENKPQRCASQTYRGVLTHIEWTADSIVLPTIEGSAASGAVICCFGLMAASRGMKRRTPDGRQVRPDHVILDDPQTDESAASVLQTRKRLSVLRKGILKLAGHSKGFSIVCNATVIQRGDMVEQLLADPSWQGERVRMVERWADRHDDLWLGEYADLRRAFDKEDPRSQLAAHERATAFYSSRRAEMDAGCVVYWSECFNRLPVGEGGELSAIQHAYNALIDDGPEVFASEYQQEPLDEVDSKEAVQPSDVAAATIAVDRMIVPAGLELVTGFVDVQIGSLWWLLAGWGNGLRGHILGYGTFPEQGRSTYTKRDLKHTLQAAAGGVGMEAGIDWGFRELIPFLMDVELVREDDSSVLKPSLVLIDSNWAQVANVVRDYCRRSPFGPRLMPASGRYVGVGQSTLSDRKPSPGERVGPHWRTEITAGVRHLQYGANEWKTMVGGKLRLPPADPGAISIHAGDHRLLAEHLSSERPTLKRARDKVANEWALLPGRDNEWWDCLVGAAAAASYLGITAVGAQPVQSRPKAITREAMAEARARLAELAARS